MTCKGHCSPLHARPFVAARIAVALLSAALLAASAADRLTTPAEAQEIENLEEDPAASSSGQRSPSATPSPRTTPAANATPTGAAQPTAARGSATPESTRGIGSTPTGSVRTATPGSESSSTESRAAGAKDTTPTASRTPGPTSDAPATDTSTPAGSTTPTAVGTPGVDETATPTESVTATVTPTGSVTTTATPTGTAGPTRTPRPIVAALPPGLRNADGLSLHVLRYVPLILGASQEVGVDPAAIAALMETEGSGESAVSHAGAMGLMQLMPDKLFPDDDPFDPGTNILRAAQLIRRLNASYRGDLAAVAGAYFGAVDHEGNITDDSDGNVTGIEYVQIFARAYERWAAAFNQPSRPIAIRPVIRQRASSQAVKRGATLDGPDRDQWYLYMDRPQPLMPETIS